MLQERKRITKNYIHVYNEILKLYIQIRQNFDPKEITKSLQNIENTNFEHRKKNINSFHKIESFNDDFQSDQAINKTMAVDLVNSVNKNTTCIVSFSRSDNYGIADINSPSNEKFKDSFNDAQLHDLIEIFFFKLNEYSTKRNKSNIYSVRYGVFNVLQKNDMLDGYEETKELQKKKSCKVATKQPVINTYMSKKCSYSDASKKGMKSKLFQSKTELNDFNEKIKAVHFSKLETLRDILNFATKNKKALLKKDNSFWHTLIVIDVSRNGGVMPFLSHHFSESATSKHNDAANSSFFFFNICYVNAEERWNISKEIRKQVYFETQLLIQEYLTGTLKRKRESFCSSICKILYEICLNSTEVYLKFVLYEPKEKEKEKEERHIISHLCKNDLELKEHIQFCITSIIDDLKKSDANKDTAERKERTEENEKILKDETYHKIDSLLFENIEVDEYTKNKIIKEALTFPQDLINYFKLVNTIFQDSYATYKEKEAEFKNDMINLIERQNEILKNYEHEETIKLNEINDICVEIDHITQQNTSVKKELEKHDHLFSKYVEKEETQKKEEIKRLDTFQNALHNEYESFLKFRSKVVHEDNLKKKEIITEESSLSDERNSDSNKEDDDNDTTDEINKMYELNYQMNLQEIDKYTKQIFQKAYELKNRCDEVIKEKEVFFKLLKITARQLNEKANSLITDFKNTQELKCIYPIEDDYTHLKNYDKDIQRTERVLPSKNIKEYTVLLNELSKNEFNEKELQWIRKMHYISKKF